MSESIRQHSGQDGDSKTSSPAYDGEGESTWPDFLRHRSDRALIFSHALSYALPIMLSPSPTHLLRCYCAFRFIVVLLRYASTQRACGMHLAASSSQRFIQALSRAMIRRPYWAVDLAGLGRSAYVVQRTDWLFDDALGAGCLRCSVNVRRVSICNKKYGSRVGMGICVLTPHRYVDDLRIVDGQE